MDNKFQRSWKKFFRHWKSGVTGEGKDGDTHGGEHQQYRVRRLGRQGEQRRHVAYHVSLFSDKVYARVSRAGKLVPEILNSPTTLSIVFGRDGIQGQPFA